MIEYSDFKIGDLVEYNRSRCYGIVVDNKQDVKRQIVIAFIFFAAHYKTRCLITLLRKIG